MVGTRKLALEQLQACLDMDVCGIKIGSASIGVESIGNLVVAGFVQSTEIIPNFRDVRVQTDSPRVGVQGITVLVDLVVEYTDRAPEGRVPSIAVDGLLVGFVGLGVLGLRHIATAKQIPTLCVSVICANRLLKVFNGLFLACIASALLVVQPAKLLQDLGMVGVTVQHSSVGGLGRLELLRLSVAARACK